MADKKLIYATARSPDSGDSRGHFMVAADMGEPVAGPEKKLRGELGALVNTILNRELAQHLFLRMEYEEEPFLGALHVRDEALCHQCHELMQRHRGSLIRQIGDLEIDSLL